MFKKNNGIKKALKTLLIMLFFTINVFAKVPHSYITENPSKEVTQTETLKKYKEKAELNVSVTKLKSKEIEGFHNPEQKKIYFSLNNIEHGIQPEDKIYLSEELQEVPSISTTNGRRKINGMLNQKILKEGALEYTVITKKDTTEIEINYEKAPKEIYIGILDKQYKIKNIFKTKELKEIELLNYNDDLGMLFNKNFDSLGWENRRYTEILFDSKKKYGEDTFIKKVSGTNRIQVGHIQHREGFLYIVVEGYDKNGTLAYKSPELGKLTSYSAAPYQWAEKNWEIILPKYYRIIIKIVGFTGNPEDSQAHGDNTIDIGQVLNVKLEDIMTKVEGESDLTIKDTYRNEYMTINSCTFDDPQNISFVNSVTGAEINQFSGKGLLKFEQGDILEVNDVQSVVNSNGGVIERNINLSGINTYYKAENGNFQIRIDDYKLDQESPQILNMKLLRNGKEIMTHKMKIFVPKITIDNNKTNVKIRDEYKGETFNVTSLPYNVKGIEYLSGNDKVIVYTPGHYRSNSYFNYLKINGITVAETKAHKIYPRILDLKGVTVEVKENSDLIIALKNYERKISKPFELKIESSSVHIVPGHDYGGSHEGHNGSGVPDRHYNYISKESIVFYYVPSKVVGNSTLEVKEYYPSPEYIAFNSCTTPAPAPIELENSLRDVKIIQNSGNGLVNLEAKDILELNGKQYTIGTGGNLQEQQDTLGNINFKFKVENGKLRLALKSWGVLEPDRLLTINASREGNPIMEHKMTIKAPRRVEGTSTLTFNEKYQIRDIVKFKGIFLPNPTEGGIEKPAPAGVTYKTNEGYGIPFMQEGDILEIQNNQTRGIQKYIIDSKNSLKQQIIDLPGTNLSLFVTDGKLRLGLNNWLVNKNTVLNFKIIRGVNEISNTSITLEVPKAPFDILKNGILDFGKLIQGSKNKKAETNILLEMHQDISNVKFSLSTTTPELVNSNGATLRARNLQAGVHKQGKNKYLVKIIGKLDVPEKQELGVYRGSVLLNVTIK